MLAARHDSIQTIPRPHYLDSLLLFYLSLFCLPVRFSLRKTMQLVYRYGHLKLLAIRQPPAALLYKLLVWQRKTPVIRRCWINKFLLSWN